ncbi:dephospho-CoA kinase [Iocasia frigidifontis]|uniref:Dephospho-CoA kinase n=1 Tax=Iocasia fonsfrigidae TaxID=2682810 RepID=A0A8A7KLK3_9FIRM|nr:dephospho-CoA kinase [Iocasia fonsfrigidae]QTL98722.1 dephospho-CoA kinase [Iocasia fonsfrigidae]
MLLGLTGGIASGKSTVSAILKELGAVIIDADKIAHQSMKYGTRAWEMIVETFGQYIQNDDGSINRRRLARLVFNDQQKKKELESITHPIIISEIKNMVNSLADNEVIVIDAPLLFEVGLDELVDCVWVVYTSRDIQLERLKERDSLTTDEAVSRIEAQLSIKEKCQMADFVIDNNGGIRELKQKIIKLWSDLNENQKNSFNCT